MSYVYSVGSTPKFGTAAETSSDALGVTSRLSQTATFQRAMSNPIERDAFLRALDARKEKALASGDKTMFDVISALSAKAKSYTAETKTVGSRLDTNNFLGI